MELQDLKIEGTHKTPSVHLRADGFMSLKGTSTPIDAAEFYFPILDWMTDYFRTPQENTSIKMELEHLNSASANTIYRLFHLLNRLQETGKSTIRCIWSFDVEDEFMIDYIESINEAAPLINIITQPRSVEFAY
jgi:hypothetical protein